MPHFVGSNNLDDLAQRILNRWGRSRDDATVVLAAPAGLSAGCKRELN